MMKVCECGCGLPVGAGRKYVDGKHKQRAYRQRGRNQRRALSRYIQHEIIELMGQEKSNAIMKHLDKVPFDNFNHEIDKALAIILVDLRMCKNGK